MRKLLFITPIILLFPNLIYPFTLTLNNTPTQVYFSPRGSCTEAIVDQIDHAKTEILVQAREAIRLSERSPRCLGG
jgi:hypothetical protein